MLVVARGPEAAAPSRVRHEASVKPLSSVRGAVCGSLSASIFYLPPPQLVASPVCIVHRGVGRRVWESNRT